MIRAVTIIVFAAVALIGPGCGSYFGPGGVFSSQLSADELAQVVDLARERIREAGIVAPAELEVIMESQPRVSYYMLAGRYDVQYSIRWRVPNGDELVIASNGGPILELRGAKAERKTAEPGATDNPDGAQRLREDH